MQHRLGGGGEGGGAAVAPHLAAISQLKQAHARLDDWLQVGPECSQTRVTLDVGGRGGGE